jgi:hypothetical protein
LWELLPVEDFDLSSLRTGWYVDYYAPGPPHPQTLDYAPVLMLSQVGEDGYQVGKSWAQIGALLGANPGAMWLIGNEPDRRIVQNDMLPAAYAAAYHDLYYYIKQRDPSAQLLAGNIVQPSPLRLRYLDLVLRAYRSRYGAPLPTDAWSIHNYILNERSCTVYPGECWGAEIPPGIDAAQGQVVGLDETARIDLFVAQVVRFRRWMAERGYRDTPLYITEYGVLLSARYGYTPEVVNRFMHATFDYLLSARDASIGYAPDGGRLVQRFSWYAVVEPRFNGGLFEGQDPSKPVAPPYVLSPIGRGYRDYTDGVAANVELHLLDTAIDPQFPPRLRASTAGEATLGFTATLTVSVSNGGNLRAPTTVRVGVYDGAEENRTLLAPLQTASLGGCGAVQKLVFRWHSPVSGTSTGVIAVAAVGGGDSIEQLLPYFVVHEKLFAPFVAAAPPSQLDSTGR